jgi:hypothetical protein
MMTRILLVLSRLLWPLVWLWGALKMGWAMVRSTSSQNAMAMGVIILPQVGFLLPYHLWTATSRTVAVCAKGCSVGYAVANGLISLVLAVVWACLVWLVVFRFQKSIAPHHDKMDEAFGAWQMRHRALEERARLESLLPAASKTPVSRRL